MIDLMDSEKYVSSSFVNQSFTKTRELLKTQKFLIVMRNNKPDFIVIDYDEYKKGTLKNIF